MAKKSKAKVWLIGIAVVLISAVTLGAVVRNNRDKEKEKETEITLTLSEEDWEEGFFHTYDSYAERNEDGAYAYRTIDFIPYNKLNISFADDLKLTTAGVIYYDEDKTGIGFRSLVDETMAVMDFEWDKRSDYSVPKETEYVRVFFMLQDSSAMESFSFDQVIVTYV